MTQGRQNIVVVSGRSHPLRRADVVRGAQAVIQGERRTAILSVAFIGRDRMRALNARWKGKDRVTDVLAFSLAGPGEIVAGDIYICPWVASREATARGIPLRRELLRLVVHGVLHVLGHDHPEDESRYASAMWTRQERLLRALARS
jgi:rRNA maturation RNase YbeY